MNIDNLKLKIRLQAELEILIKNKWGFLNNKYEPIEKTKFHRTELQEIKNIEIIKKNIEDKIGVIPTFVFLTDFCNKFNIPGPYKNIDKGLIILPHLLCGSSINQMQQYLNYTAFFRIYKFIYVTHYDDLNNWINNLMYTCFSNKNIRILSSYINNPDLVKHVTMILDGHHNKIVYENITVDKKELYSWKLKKSGLNTQFIIDMNEIVLYVSESLSCRDNNDDKMLINNINFNKFFTIYDNICFDGIYINTLLETIDKYSLRNIEMKETNFTYPINKEKNKDLTDDQILFNNHIGSFRSRIETYFANLGKIFNRFNAENNIRVTKLETYNIQLRLACTLMNINKIVKLSNLDINHVYTLWLNDGFDYPDADGIVPKSDVINYKLNNITVMKNIQIDLINSMMHNNLNITEDTKNENIIVNNNSSSINEYEVQYIIKHRIKNNKKEYLVKWRGYGKKYNSWVNEEDFIEKDIISDYNKDIVDDSMVIDGDE